MADNHNYFADGILVHNCHLVNSKGGMYEHFIGHLGVPALGLTATPYRLRHYNHHETGEHVAESRILTRTRPRVFDRIAHVTQVAELLAGGWLAPCSYERDADYREGEVAVNSTGQGYDERALASYNEKLGITHKIAAAVRAAPARHVLVFCQFRAESERVLSLLKSFDVDAAIVDAETPKRIREAVLSGFRLGRIRAVVNVGVLTVGFDFPELDAIVLGRPTKSVALYYQMIGRGIRPAAGKESCLVIDLCDNVRRFGRIETFELIDQKPGRGLWRLRSDAGPLTGVDITTKVNVESVPLPPEAQANAELEITFGKHKGIKLGEVPLGYLRWAAENFGSGAWRTAFRVEIERRQKLGLPQPPAACQSARLFEATGTGE
ncbi:MAG: helicase-related protein [Planctomycetota bacterium]